MLADRVGRVGKRGIELDPVDSGVEADLVEGTGEITGAAGSESDSNLRIGSDGIEGGIISIDLEETSPTPLIILD